jgi:hypothetical protein
MQGLFNTESIEANKQGKKSEKQIKEIKEAVNPATWLWGGLAVVGLGGCFYLVLATLAGGGGGVIDIFVWILGLAGLFAFLRGLTIWNLRRKLFSEPIQSADGTIKFGGQDALTALVTSDHYSAQTYEEKKLHPLGLAGVNPKLPPGDYRFYFLNTRGWLLAAEPLFDETEMRTTVNDLLASALGYDQAFLENCRMEANLGQMKTFEGLPNLEVHEGIGTGENYEPPDYYCTLGNAKFQVSGQLQAFIYDGLPYRAYYRDMKPPQLVALEVCS